MENDQRRIDLMEPEAATVSAAPVAWQARHLDLTFASLAFHLGRGYDLWFDLPSETIRPMTWTTRSIKKRSLRHPS